MRCNECPALLEHEEFYECLINAMCKKLSDGSTGCKHNLKIINRHLDEKVDDISVEIGEMFSM